MNTKGLVRFIVVGIVLLLVISVGGYFLFRPRSQITVVGTVDIPVGDDLTTSAVEGAIQSFYGADIPISILKGTGTYPANFSVTIKIREVSDTRIVVGEILSPTTFEQQPSHTGILYLCSPLSEKADKLSDGTIVYKGTGYPQIIVGKSYDVTGVLQPVWQDYPFVYIPTASQFRQTSSGN
jgi:hypothetical protein